MLSRRGILKGGSLFLFGGIAGYFNKASFASASVKTADNPPPLPWPWVKLDPLEAGRRTYRAYLEKGG